MSVSYLTLHRGNTFAEAQTIAVTCDPEIIAEFAARMLTTGQFPDTPDDCPDPVRRALNKGRRDALRIIAEED